MQDQTRSPKLALILFPILTTSRANGKVLAKVGLDRRSRERLLYLTETAVIFIALTIRMFFVLMGINMF